MHAEDYEHLYALEENFWWFAGMRDVTAALLDSLCPPGRDRVILDAGCGTGSNLKWLRRYVARGSVFGIDNSADALHFCKARGEEVLAFASVTALPFSHGRFDLVTSFDVLAQLSREAGKDAVREMFRVMRPGGIAFVRTAAYEWMRSGHDQALGTQSRYSLAALRSLLTSEGFIPMRVTYANTLLLPAAAFRRLVLKPIRLVDSGSDVKPLAPQLRWLNTGFQLALNMEAGWLRATHVNLPVGLSAICIAQKPVD
jgi:ubiquinone/menaquinone biosynthesis C-methylase UbiE